MRMELEVDALSIRIEFKLKSVSCEQKISISSFPLTTVSPSPLFSEMIELISLAFHLLLVS